MLRFVFVCVALAVSLVDAVQPDDVPRGQGRGRPDADGPRIGYRFPESNSQCQQTLVFLHYPNFIHSVCHLSAFSAHDPNVAVESSTLNVSRHDAVRVNGKATVKCADGYEWTDGSGTGTKTVTCIDSACDGHRWDADPMPSCEPTDGRCEVRTDYTRYQSCATVQEDIAITSAPAIIETCNFDCGTDYVNHNKVRFTITAPDDMRIRITFQPYYEIECGFDNIRFVDTADLGGMPATMSTLCSASYGYWTARTNCYNSGSLHRVPVTSTGNVAVIEICTDFSVIEDGTQILIEFVC